MKLGSRAPLAYHRAKVAQQHQDTLDYENRILHSPGRAIDWGSYTVHGRYHVIHNSHAAAYDAVKHRGAYEDGVICSTCWEHASREYGPDVPECHTCSDWGGCGSNCTRGPLLSVACKPCGWEVRFT